MVVQGADTVKPWLSLVKFLTLHDAALRLASKAGMVRLKCIGGAFISF